MFCSKLTLTLILLVLLDVACASNALAHRNPRHHSSLVRRSNAHLTRRAQRCAAATKAPINGTSSPVTALVQSTWLCNGQPSHATETITPTDGPNGQQSWLNCGINTPHGWNPPPLTIHNIAVVDLSTALKDPASPYHVCAPYIPFFEKHAAAYNLPPILFAAFSMQESGCNPSTIGGAGEQGLMQITKDKCVGAPHNNCLDPDFNIGQAVKYFAATLAEDNGNILLSVGRYNGWHRNMTFAEATAAGHTACCRCQNNLDYAVQFFNGWLLNRNAYKLELGSIFNLKICKQQT